MITHSYECKFIQSLKISFFGTTPVYTISFKNAKFRKFKYPGKARKHLAGARYTWHWHSFPKS